MALPVLVINRAQDTGRLAQFAASARQFGVSFDRIDAVDGHAPGALVPFAGLIGPHFWGEPHAKPGAIGCFLSHRRAWQAVVDRDLSHVLICEDDAVFHRTPSDLSGHMNDSGETDVLFVNQRLGSWAGAVSRDAMVPMPQVIAALTALGGPGATGLKTSPGGDGYVVTAAGARHLLALTAQQGVVCGVDWAMVWNSLSGLPHAVSSAFPELGLLRDHLALPERPLRACVMTGSLVDQSGKGGSMIKHRITVPIIDLTARPSGGGQ